MIVTKLCTLAFTLTLIPFSIFSQTTFYTATYSIDDKKAQDQYYKVEQNQGTTTIQERGIFLSNPDIYAFSESKMDSLGYVSVLIAFDNGNVKSRVAVNRADHNHKLYYSYLNGTVVDSIQVEDSVVFLFDGPNPTYDVLNSRFLKANKGETVTLGLINWINGSLSTEPAYYIIGKNEVAIHKKRTNRFSFLFLNKKDILPKNCYQNKESYEFTKTESLPMELER